MILTLSLLLAAAVGVPSAVLWAAGFAAFVGFIFGSVPTSGENRGWRFDMQGALLWAMAAGLVAGGLVSCALTGLALPALAAMGLGGLCGMMRLIATRPPRTPRQADLPHGITRVTGDSPAAKAKAAKRLYYNASFRSGDNYWATRGLKEFSFGSAGMTADDLAFLKSGTLRAYPDTFDILVLHVTCLPGTENEPGVVVVRGAQNLRQITYGADYLELPGIGKVQARTVCAMVGYAWR